MNDISANYTASEAIAKPLKFALLVKATIEQHLKSIQGIVQQEEIKLELNIFQCVLRENYGQVGIHLTGTVNGQIIDQKFSRFDEPEKPSYLDDSRASMTAYTNVLTFFLRLFFPSKAVRCLGKRRINGRAIRALDDVLADIRIHLDQTLRRPPSEAKNLLETGTLLAIKSGLLTFLVSIAVFFLRLGHFNDDIRAGLGCLFLPLGVAGTLYGLRLLTLPSQFYLNESAGRKMVKLIGVKSVKGIGAFAFGLALFSFLVVAAGFYWLVIE